MNPLIIHAIRNRQCLEFSYNGFRRIVEPHAYGITKTGSAVLRAYQIAGGHASTASHSNNPWHLFTVSKMHGITMTGTAFAGVRPGYAPGDAAMATIYAQR